MLIFIETYDGILIQLNNVNIFSCTPSSRDTVWLNAYINNFTIKIKEFPDKQTAIKWIKDLIVSVDQQQQIGIIHG